CQDVCPATNTGKALSPAAILINERFELNAIFPSFAAGQESPRPLLDFALNEEAAWACTTCNACVEVCPVGNEQMLHIIDVRRERVLAAAEFPNGLKNTFNHMERAGNPWGISADERLTWAKPKVIVTTCPHCFHTIANEYPQFGGNYQIKHHTQFITELMQNRKLKVSASADGSMTYHDPCYLGRHNGIFDQPRALIQSTGAQLTEPQRNRSNSFCCGAGGGQFWKEEEKGNERVSTNRYRELKQTGAKTVATGCPFCMRMITEETAKEEEGAAPQVLDIAEIVAKNLTK